MEEKRRQGGVRPKERKSVGKENKTVSLQEDFADSRALYEHEGDFAEIPASVQPDVELEAWKPFAAVDKSYLASKEQRDDDFKNVTKFNPIMRGLATAYFFDDKYKNAYSILCVIHDVLKHDGFETALMRAECELALNDKSVKYDRAVDFFCELVAGRKAFTEKDVEEWSDVVMQNGRHVGRILLNIASYRRFSCVDGKWKPRSDPMKEMHIADIFAYFEDIVKCLKSIKTSTFSIAATSYVIDVLSGIVDDMGGTSAVHCNEFDSSHLSLGVQVKILRANCCNSIAAICIHTGRWSYAITHAKRGIELMTSDKEVKVENPSRHLVYGNLHENIAIAKYNVARAIQNAAEESWSRFSNMRKKSVGELKIARSDTEDLASQMLERSASEIIEECKDNAMRALSAYSAFVLGGSKPDHQEALRRYLKRRVMSLISKADLLFSTIA